MTCPCLNQGLIKKRRLIENLGSALIELNCLAVSGFPMASFAIQVLAF